MVRKIFWPSINILGAGALKEAVLEIKKMNLGKALIVTDKILYTNGIVNEVIKNLKENNLEYAVYSDVIQNPTIKNVNDGLSEYMKTDSTYIISVGGGSPQDVGKAIGILVTNGGNIVDYNGAFKSRKKSVPIVAINTTAGTASEVTINYVITDEYRKIKMVMVDSNCLPTIAVNDPELMLKKPKSLTAGTGMDALTHAIESYVTKGAYELTDVLSLESIKLIGESLVDAVENGNDIQARDKMAWGSYIAGLSFSNCGLGIVHALAHQLGSEYDMPHGVANAILLPYVMEYNLSSNFEKFKNIAKALKKDITNKSIEQSAFEAIIAVKELSKKVDIPKLKDTKFNIKDIDKLSKQAHEDICSQGNPKDATIEDLKQIYINAYND